MYVCERDPPIETHDWVCCSPISGNALYLEAFLISESVQHLKYPHAPHARACSCRRILLEACTTHKKEKSGSPAAGVSRCVWVGFWNIFINSNIYSTINNLHGAI
jgi:hypothetical protein